MAAGAAARGTAGRGGAGVKTFTDTAAERALIASVFLAGDLEPARIVALTGDTFARLSQVVRAEDFSDGRHARVWAAMARVVDAGRGVEVVTVGAELRRVPGAAVTMEFLAGLTVEAVSPENAEAFAFIVADLAGRRRAIAAADAHRARLLDGEDVAGSVVALEAATRDGVVGTRDLSANAAMVDAWAEMIDGGGKSAVYGNATLDGEALGGIFPSQLTVVGAVPGGGKSALAVTAAVATAERGGRVLFASLEMPRSEVAWRMAAGYARRGAPPLDMIRQRRVSEEDMADLQVAATKVAELPMLIEDRPLTVNALCALARAENARGALSLVVVDYLHMLQRDVEDLRTREDELLRRQAYALKNLAKALKCPVMALSQFNRVGAKAERPTMFDALGGSGIEQAADNVVILVPDEGTEVREPRNVRVRVRVHIDKRRGGPVCREGVMVLFNKSRQRFGATEDEFAAIPAAGDLDDGNGAEELS